MHPRKFLEMNLLLRTIWDRSRIVVPTWFAKYCIQFLAVYVSICEESWLRIPKREGTWSSRWGDITRKTTCELLNAWNSDLFTHAFMRILSSQRWRARSKLVLYEQTRIAANRLVLAMILSRSETTSGLVSNGRALKMYSKRCIYNKSFGGQ